MRAGTPPVSYLVGTPKGKLTTLEDDLLHREWKHARPKVRVKLLPKEGETYVLAESGDRILKERSMRRRRLRKYLDALNAITRRKRPLQRDAVHQAIGAAKKEAGRDARFVTVSVQHHLKEKGKNKGSDNGKDSGKQKNEPATLTYKIDRQKLREARRREGRYLLRTNLTEEDPAKLWEYYLQLTEVEQAFKELKGDLALRPIHHQLDHRIEAHIMIQSPPHGSFTPAGLLLRRSLSRPLPGASAHLLPGLRPANHPQSPAQAKRHRPHPPGCL